MNWKNILERLFWTVVQSAAGAVLTAQTLDITALQAAGVAAATSAIALLSLIARDRLSVIGDGPQV